MSQDKTPSRFTKKPVTIEAVQYNGTLQSLDALFIPEVHQDLGSNACQIPTLEGVMTAQPGDWIIKGVKGEFYPCKPDIFEATYSPAHLERTGQSVTNDEAHEAALWRSLPALAQDHQLDLMRLYRDAETYLATATPPEAATAEAAGKAPASVPSEAEVAGPVTVCTDERMCGACFSGQGKCESLPDDELITRLTAEKNAAVNALRGLFEVQRRIEELPMFPTAYATESVDFALSDAMKDAAAALAAQPRSTTT